MKALLAYARSTSQPQTKCGGRIMHCACTIRLNAKAAVTTASTKRLVIVTGLVIERPVDPEAGDRLRWDGLMVKLGIRLISSIVASVDSRPLAGPVRIERPVGLRLGQPDPLQIVQQDQDVAVDLLASLFSNDEAAGQLLLITGITLWYVRIGAGHQQYSGRRFRSLGGNEQAQNTRLRDVRPSAPASWSSLGVAA